MSTENPPAPEISEDDESLDIGIEFPSTGRLSLQGWANKFHRSQKTVRRWIEKYNVRYKPIGTYIVIDAEDWWAAIPFVEPQKVAPPKRGGSRKKRQA